MIQPYKLCPTPRTARGLCNGGDSIGHIAGGCQHPTMHALYITRHGTACRILSNTIRKGEQGGFYMMAGAAGHRRQTSPQVAAP